MAKRWLIRPQPKRGKPPGQATAETGQAGKAGKVQVAAVSLECAAIFGHASKWSLDFISGFKRILSLPGTARLQQRPVFSRLLSKLLKALAGWSWFADWGTAWQKQVKR